MKPMNRFTVVIFTSLLAATFAGPTAADEEGTQYSGPAPAGSALPTPADDTAITARVKDQIFNEPSLKSSGIEVETSHGVVRLSGFVGSEEQALTAVQFANTVAGVVSVTNDIQVK